MLLPDKAELFIGAARDAQPAAGAERRVASDPVLPEGERLVHAAALTQPAVAVAASETGRMCLPV